MVVKVTCLSNKKAFVYPDTMEMEQGMFWNDDIEELVIGLRLRFANGETATYRNGFLIEMYANQWEYDNGIRRLKITV